jgi:hypothetical protein
VCVLLLAGGDEYVRCMCSLLRAGNAAGHSTGWFGFALGVCVRVSVHMRE